MGEIRSLVESLIIIVMDFSEEMSVCIFSGLENIFLLTARKNNELRFDMEDWDGVEADARYSSFSIDSEKTGYMLHLGSFSGGSAGEDH